MYLFTGRPAKMAAQIGTFPGVGRDDADFRLPRKGDANRLARFDDLKPLGRQIILQPLSVPLIYPVRILAVCCHNTPTPPR